MLFMVMRVPWVFWVWERTREGDEQERDWSEERKSTVRPPSCSCCSRSDWMFLEAEIRGFSRGSLGWPPLPLFSRMHSKPHRRSFGDIVSYRGVGFSISVTALFELILLYIDYNYEKLPANKSSCSPESKLTRYFSGTKITSFSDESDSSPLSESSRICMAFEGTIALCSE